MSGVVIQIDGVVHGFPSPYDGQYVVEYQAGVAGDHGPFLRTSFDQTQAKVFPDYEAARECWMQRRGTRPDGNPDRPLTVFNVIIEPPIGAPAREDVG